MSAIVQKKRSKATVEKPFVDRRVQKSRAAVLKETVQLLCERGYGGVSVDEVARRSGVAKTTIYRHWAHKALLLRDACSMISTPLQLPDTGGFESDLRQMLLQLAHLLRTEQWPGVLPSVIDAAERDSDIADMYRDMQKTHSDPLRSIILRAIQHRELPRDTDVAQIVAESLGPLFYRRWFSREAVNTDFIQKVVRDVVTCQKPRQPPS